MTVDNYVLEAVKELKIELSKNKEANPEWDEPDKIEEVIDDITVVIIFLEVTMAYN